MIRVIIIDDERPALKNLERLLKQYENIDIVGMFTDIFEAFEIIKKGSIDVVFLDMDMPHMKGIEAAEKILKMKSYIEIVFVTAYEHYALDAFEVNAIDYVMKPVLKRRFDKTIDRIIKKHLDISGENIDNKILCFGKFEWISMGKVIKWRTAKTKELIAYLIHHKGKPVHKDKIIEILWPDKSQEQAVKLLHTSIYNIRKALKTIGFEEGIIYSDEMYNLNIEKMYSDFDEFEQIITTENEITQENIKIFERAIQLYHGDYFGENDFVWAKDEQAYLSGMYINVLKQIANFYVEKEEYNHAVVYLKKIIEKNPFIDEVHKMLLFAYGNMEDYIAFDNHYKQLYDTYRLELGVEFCLSVKELYRSFHSGK